MTSKSKHQTRSTSNNFPLQKSTQSHPLPTWLKCSQTLEMNPYQIWILLVVAILVMLLQNTVISTKALESWKKWSDLPEILEKDNKKVVPVDGKGLCLMEAISTSLSLEYDILIEPDKLIELISKEVCTHPEYTKYLKVPLSQDELNYNLMAFHSTKKYSRVVADVYLPAISSALDLHIRTIQNISGFFGVVNTYPLDNFNNKKTVTLIVIDDIYQPVVAKQVDAELAPAPAIPALQSEYPVIVISDCESEVVVEYSQEVDPSPVFGFR